MRCNLSCPYKSVQLELDTACLKHFKWGANNSRHSRDEGIPAFLCFSFLFASQWMDAPNYCAW